MGKGKSSARAARRNGGGTGTTKSPQQKTGRSKKGKKGRGGGGRAGDPGGWMSRTSPRTDLRMCEGRQEQQQRRPGELYPFYYVTHKLVWHNAQGRPCRKRICDDCHNNEWLAYELRWLREQGYGRDDAVVVQAEEVLADAAAATAVQPDGSASGAAIEAAGQVLLHDEDGELCEIDLAECRMLPEGDEQLREEIALGVLATMRERSSYDQVVGRLRAQRDAAAATAVDPAAVARLVAQATGGDAGGHRMGGM